jgi:hypothetical protein
MKNLLLISCILTITLETMSQTFTRITTGPVVTTPGDSRSVNWIDLNDDGMVDLFISNGKAGGQNNMMYTNIGSGSFVAATGDPLVTDGKPSDGATFADTDNDGDADAYIVNWYNFDNLFYLNDGIANFTEVTGTDVVNTNGYCETASWGDYDNDGLVDLYMSRSGGGASTDRNRLYHNDGGNIFTEITSGSPVTDLFTSRSVNWTDMDNDGDLDLFVTNEGLTNNDENIYRNDSGSFTRITSGVLVNNGGFTMSSSWGDYDNDGDLDVFLANDQSSNALFRNDGIFTFTKITGDTVSNTNAHSFSSAWSDVDNDGDLDLFVTNTYNSAFKQLNFFYLNNGDGSFERVGTSPLATDSSWSYGCAFGDYDNDGFEDLAVATVSFNNVDEPDFLYHNDGNGNHWSTIKLVGTITNRSAIGTKIRMKAIIGGIPVWQMREISAQSSYCGQNDLRTHFGLKDATVIDSIKVEWLSGTIEYFTNIATDSFFTITEGQGITGMNFPEEKNNFMVYPNPTTGNLKFDFSKVEMTEENHLTISDSGGKIIYSKIIGRNSFDLTIDLSTVKGIRQGLHYVMLSNSNGMIFKKVIKLN